MSTEKLIISLILFLFLLRMVIVLIVTYVIKPKTLSEEEREAFDQKEDESLL